MKISVLTVAATAVVAAGMVAGAARSATIDDLKAKPAKYSYVGAATMTKAIACIQTNVPYRVDVIHQEDGSVDLAFTNMGWRAALFTLTSGADGLRIDGRGPYGKGINDPKMKACMGVPA